MSEALKSEVLSDIVNVMMAICPARRLVKSLVIAIVGLRVSMEKLEEEAVPLPALPARSVTCVRSREIALAGDSIPVFGVKVAVQVAPPSDELKVLSVALLSVSQALLKLLTRSEKVIITTVVSPAASEESLRAMVAVGAVRSTSKVRCVLEETPSLVATAEMV